MKCIVSAQAKNFLGDIKKPEFSALNNLVIISCDYFVDYYQDSLYEELGISHPSFFPNAVTKRKAEYLAGRYTAISALAEIGLWEKEIPTGEHRSPVWPSSVVGSISHTKSVAVSAVAYQTDYAIVGIDAENWLMEQTVEQIQKSILRQEEVGLLKRSTMDYVRAFTLVFSAKESLFKALYPQVGHYFDFMAAQIIELSVEKQKFKLVLTENLTDQLLQGSCFSGQFSFNTQGITTIIVG
ncbi:4'-phosphopantetheinyl transferase family protein [Aliikangiella sp. IMCC44359]|uniref:4'-phosphopantetheinyl transferase family protein n=1 Tax=Aliikangiella sp. IMCC44359 TaxID=3459125 RepID=UPI00403AA2A9